jgi:selenocysteine lyase/cysteine desulfurase
VGRGGWSRREFLAASGAIAGVSAVGATAACSSNHQDENPQADGQRDFDPADWASVRDQFPLDPNLHHFAAFVLAAHPRPVGEAISRYRDALDLDTEAALVEFSERDTEVRAAAATYLGAEPDEIALTDSTTMGLGLVYGGLRLNPGEEILTTEHDFYSTHEALRWRSIRGGHQVRRVRLYDDASQASVDEIVSRLVAAITPASRLVAVTWVHSSTGVRLPIAEIAAALADVNATRDEADRALLSVDGVHGFGAVDVTAADLGCDFLISGTHKWLFGPRGTGLVWGKRSAWARLDPVIPPFSSEGFNAWTLGDEPARTVPGTLFTPGGYHSFEHRWALGQAFDFHDAIGKSAVAERIRVQATALKAGLADIAGVKVITPQDPELSAGIVCLTVDGQEPPDTLGGLRDQDILASLTPYATSYVRLGPSIVTTPDEVTQVISTIANLS